MKNVSFNGVIEKREISRLTPHQVRVDDMVGTYLESCRPENNYLESVDTMVSDNMFSDILLIHKKDGSTEIKLIDDTEKKKEYGVEWFTIDGKDKKPLIIRAKDSYEAVHKKLANYAEQLKKLSSEYYGRLINDTRFYKDIKE